MFNVKLKPVVLAVAGVLAAASTVYAADAIKADKVDVISVTPLPSLGITLKEIPSNVQTISGSDLKNSQALDLSSYMNQSLGSVYINETQGNPIQGDLNYRGYTASPLLGTPQGLSVYMDGVRLNQPFGDVVSWDLIPKNAIKSVQLMPGSNPLFGLNTLGGAISIQTKDGRTSQGGAVQTTFGSYGRKIGEFEYGGVSKDGSVDYFIAGTAFEENGWRDNSKSDYKQLFSKIGWQGEKTDLKLTFAYADTDLNGNGLMAKSHLARNWGGVYTYPDNTKNENYFLNLNLSHYFKDNVMLSGNAYYRHIDTKTLNGDINETALPEYLGGAGQTITSGNAYTTSGASTTCLGQMNSLGGEPGEKCIGAINRGKTKQDNAGFTGQVSVDQPLFGMENKYVIGAGYDWSKMHYQATSEYGWLSSNLVGSSIIGSGRFANLATGGVLDGEMDDRSVNLKGSTETMSLFFADNLKPTEKLNLSGALRYNYTKVNNRDQQTHYEYGVDEYDYRVGTTYTNTFDNSVAYRYYPNEIERTNTLVLNENSAASLSGNHKFHRLNPSLGFTYNVNDEVNVYGGYNEGSRAPTSIELGCANPDQGCRLPNAMAGDPPLKQVVSKTFEGGLRGNLAGTKYNISAYNSSNEDDIMFVATSTSEGYFKNFGETRRRGLEMGFSRDFGALTLAGNYSFIDATYQTPETVGGTANTSGTNNAGSPTTLYYSCNALESQADCVTRGATTGGAATVANRTIDIKKGDRIPLIPRQMLKIGASYKVTDTFNIGADTVSIADAYVRGNENNQGDGGSVAAYTLVNLSASYRPSPSWLVFARVNNVFDKQYFTGGQLGLSPFNPNTGALALSGNSSTAVGETFVAPGAPINGWIGVRYEFGGPAKK